MNRKNKSPFSIEIKIEDEKGNKIFKWHKSHNNIILGLSMTNKFVNEKLGIDNIMLDEKVEENWKKKKR